MNIGRILCIGYTTNTGQLNTLTHTRSGQLNTVTYTQEWTS